MMRAPHNAAKRRQAAGFSIIELMVSVVIGLLALMFATGMITKGEATKQAALGGSDAMQNGVTAMLSMSGDANQAGFGLNDPIINGCDTLMMDGVSGTDYQMAPATRAGTTITPLAAAVIVNGGTAPDKISFYAGGAVSGTASVRLIQAYDGGAAISVDRDPYGFAAKDVIVVAPETVGARCSLVEVSATPVSPVPTGTVPTLRFDSGAGLRFNQGVLGNTFTVKSRVFNLGQASKLSFHTWSVADGFLKLSATDVLGTEKTAASVADNIVSIKAQYGFDTRAGAAFTPETGMQVKQWSATMIDADGTGVIGSAEDYQRIAAIRLAVVARSKTPERIVPPATTCSATTDAQRPTVFAAAQPSGVAAVPIVVDLAVAGDPTDWHCYRYRVFETIVPIRNSAWRPTAWAK